MTLLEDATVAELEEALAERRARYSLEIIPLNDPDPMWHPFAIRLTRADAIRIGNWLYNGALVRMRMLTNDPGEEIEAVGAWGFQADDDSWKEI